MLKPLLKVKKGNPDFAAAKQKVDDMKKNVFDKMPKIVVGLPKNSTPYPDGTSVVMVGFWNEFGSMDGVVPARPWLRTGANDNRAKWIKMARDIVKKCLKTGRDPLNHFNILGLQMEADIKNSIATGEWEPNQGAYGDWKISKGYTKPLMVTGHMRASVRYIIYEATKS